MAELDLKNSMEFFYIEDEFVSKLLDELESRYKYQKILLVGADKYVKDEILSQKQREIYYIFENDFTSTINNFATVVCFDKSFIDTCKAYCYKNKINYISVLDSYVSIDTFCLFKGVNQLLGVVFDKKKIQSTCTDFAYKFIIDCALVCFWLTEKFKKLLFLLKKNTILKTNLKKF